MTVNYRRNEFDKIAARLHVGMETAEEDLRNAMQTLVAWRFEPMPPDVNELVRLRIDAALRKLGR